MADETGYETATLAGGCYWCLEAVYTGLRGVVRVQSGFAGGHKASPTYREVCTGTTGHAEVVRLTYDPRELSYDDLLRVFFTIHDPTTLNRQGGDVGEQYRSAIFTESPAQESAARRIMAEVAAEGIWGAKLVTTVQPLDRFWPAPIEHDDYYARNPNTGYCQAVVAPKVLKFRKKFAGRLKAPAQA